jgi:hypothetical protein
MFRIVMHALWSRDYASALVRLFGDLDSIGPGEAKAVFDDLCEGRPREIICETPGQAYDLSTDLLQFGVYTSCEQIGPVTHLEIARDTIHLLHEDLSMFMVFVDEKGHVKRLVEQNTLGYITMEDEEALALVAAKVLESGGTAIDQAQMLDIQYLADSLRDERVAYAKMMTERHGRDWKRILWEMRNPEGSEREVFDEDDYN